MSAHLLPHLIYHCLLFLDGRQRPRKTLELAHRSQLARGLRGTDPGTYLSPPPHPAILTLPFYPALYSPWEPDCRFETGGIWIMGQQHLTGLPASTACSHSRSKGVLGKVESPILVQSPPGLPPSWRQPELSCSLALPMALVVLPPGFCTDSSFVPCGAFPSDTNCPLHLLQTVFQCHLHGERFLTALLGRDTGNVAQGRKSGSQQGPPRGSLFSSSGPVRARSEQP